MQGTRTHCPYCALQCGMVVTRDSVRGDESFDVNAGALCVKGFTSIATVDHPERVTAPLVRNANGELAPASWDEALDQIVRAMRAAQEKHGRDAVGVFGGGSLTNEKAYLLGKLARVAIGTANIDYNGRFCMSSAAAAANLALGIDRGLPFPVADIAEAEVVMIVGGNPAETMPPLVRYLNDQRARGGRLVVVDPRASLTADLANVHLRARPGTDAAIANGILHVLIAERAVDTAFIEARTTGFDEARRVAQSYWPERVERITGVAAGQIVEVARMLARARSAMILSGRGAEQQARGVDNVLAFIDVALALGLPGKRASGFGAMTGQGNGQGGREHGQKNDQLPGYRSIRDPAARAHVAAIWGVDPDALPSAGLSAYELLEACGDAVRALFVVGSNVLVSAPRALAIEARLRALDFLVVSDFFLSETAAIADVVLPSAQWAEEEGTMTNLEGRVLRRRRAFDPPPDVRSDLEVICELGARLGHRERFTYAGPEAVFDELARASAGGKADYSGMSYAAIDRASGIHWPCPDQGNGGTDGERSNPGTPRLFADTFPTADGRARFFAIEHAPSAEEPDPDYPFYLTTGRVLAQYQSGTQTRRVAALVNVAPEPFVEMSQAAAAHVGVRDGELATLTTRRGRCHLRVRVSRRMRFDTVFVPFHWGGEQAINRLTSSALDPRSKMPELKLCAVRIAPHAAAAEG